MGSPTDMKYAVQAETVLEQLGVWYIANVRSAHRTPRALELYTEQAEIDPYIKLHISVAGMAAAQPGYIAAKSIKPVIGIPSEGSLSILGGLDAVFSMLQMPPYAGPVLTVGIKNGINAGIAAAQILAIEDEELKLRLRREIRKPE
ncbi:MAG: AIR carboxylase family protein [Candidatus Micrarchaeota archaeon]|nr:AIR carboxylase family protein [Candidatus Micrarchaeota archaeon]MDE1848236.1 AIR carboxylase family protein [Candidatus Micrarchaeota archaeon]MDE1864910.1 AIR carboxylase family protein [Candidatus Micrarchaeota archaeon]